MYRRWPALLKLETRYVLVAAGAIALVGWAKGINLLILLSSSLLALVLVNAILARRQVLRLLAERRFPDPLFANETGRWIVRIHNPSAQAVRDVMIVDSEALPGSESPDPSWNLDKLDSGASIELTAAWVFRSRGRRKRHPLRLICRYPFGIVERTRIVGASAECVVYPALGRLNMSAFRRWLAQVNKHEGQQHRQYRPSMIHQDDLHGLRVFRPGDNPRWIHWRTSARRNIRMVREFEEETGQRLILIIDPRTRGSSERFEETISLVATICWQWCRHHQDFLGLIVPGAPEPLIEGYPTQDLASRMLETLALMTATPVVDWSSIPAERLRYLPADAVVLFVSAAAEDQAVNAASMALHRPVIGLDLRAAREFYEAGTASAQA